VFGNYGLKKKSVPVIFEPPCTNLMKFQEGAGVDLLYADNSVCSVYN